MASFLDFCRILCFVNILINVVSQLEPLSFSLQFFKFLSIIILFTIINIFSNRETDMATCNVQFALKKPAEEMWDSIYACIRLLTYSQGNVSGLRLRCLLACAVEPKIIKSSGKNLY